MANTTFNTRIKLKYDTLANWTTNKTKVLLNGEIGLCYVPAVTTNTTTTAPTVLFKVGDGKTTWESLPWGSGLAADVYDWAKATTKPSYDYSEIKNTPTMTVDTNTTYKLVQDGTDKHKFTLQSQEKGTSIWTTVSTITIPDNNNNQTIKVGNTTFGANDAILLSGDGVEITPDTTTTNKKITFKVTKATNADHATNADKATNADNAAKATSADKVANALTLQIGGTTKATFDGSSAKTFNVTAADLGLSSAMHFIGTATVAITEDSTTDPKITGYTFANAQKGDVILYNHLEFVWDGTKWEKLGDDSSYALKTITAKATDDDVVVLTGTSGSNGVTFDAKHAKKGPTGGATKGATADVSVSGYGASGSIKVPKVVVDEYGHTTGLTEQTLSITMPAAQTLPAAGTVTPKNLGTATVGTSTKYAREDHVHKMPTLNEISANTSANYVIFDCGSSTVNI